MYLNLIVHLNGRKLVLEIMSCMTGFITLYSGDSDTKSVLSVFWYNNNNNFFLIKGLQR